MSDKNPTMNIDLATLTQALTNAIKQNPSNQMDMDKFLEKWEKLEENKNAPFGKKSFSGRFDDESSSFQNVKNVQKAREARYGTNDKLLREIQRGFNVVVNENKRQKRKEMRRYGRPLTGDERRAREAAKNIRLEKAQSIVDKVIGFLNGAVQIASAIQDGALAIKRSDIQEQKNAFDRQQKIFQAHMDMSNTVAQSVITTISSFSTQRATEASRAIAKTAYSEANAQIKYYTAVQMANREYEVAEKERGINEHKAIAAAAASGVQGISTIVSLFGPIGMLVGSIVNGLAGVAKGVDDMVIKYQEFNLEKMKQENEVYQQMMGRMTQVADKIKGIVEAFDGMSNAIADVMRETEKTYKRQGMTMGFKGDQFSSYMRNLAVGAARTYGLKAEDMKGMSDSYDSASGRTKIMSLNDYNQMESISRTFGIGNTEVAQLMGEMNIFNTSISDGFDMMDRMYHTATKLGLSTSKFSKDLVNNLKLAQKYNFRGGVDNMAKLTMWAERTRFNLQNATTFADKMMSNNISEVLETSAKLQVLGGNAAIYADPMAMMWEAGNDVGALAKRQAAIFGDITGSFNSRTGETTFTEMDLRMIKARAEAMGMNYEDVLNQKRQSNKQGVINRQLKGYGLDEETLNGIGQRATYDKKTGKFMVDTLKGKMSIDQVAGMGEGERNSILMPANEQDSIFDIAKSARSLVELEDAQLLMWQTLVGKEMWDTVVSVSKQSREEQTDFYKNQKVRDQMSESQLAQAKQSAEQLKTMQKMLDSQGGALKDYREYVLQNLGKSVVLQEGELALLRIMATPGGIDKYSALSSLVGQMTTAETVAERTQIYNDFKRQYARDKDMIKMLNEFLPHGANTYNHEYNINDGIVGGGGFSGYNKSRQPVITAPNAIKVEDAIVGNRNDGVAEVNGIKILAKGDGGLVTALRALNMSNTGNNSNTTHTINGTLNLTGAGVTVDLMQQLKSDPILARDLLLFLTKEQKRGIAGRVSYQDNF